MTTNAFGHEVLEIRELVQDEAVRDYLANVLTRQLTILGSTQPADHTREIIILAQTTDAKDYDSTVLAFTEDVFDMDIFKRELERRIDIMYGEIVGFVGESPVLDYGCGSGGIGQLLRNAGHEVDFADIYKHRDIPKDAKFYDLSKKPDIPQKYQRLLLLTVAHHSNTPIQTLENTASLLVSGRELVIIKSVYGVHKRDTPFERLNDEQQWKAAAFIDHFGNRFLLDRVHPINVPYNYQTPPQWKRSVEALGLERRVHLDLRVDIPVVPEYHTLDVFKKL